eukprot:GEMP01028424.1.p1 GENE.GEMP01028424.1~~GEMP01028424.1.p1  ORF type:complete len:288 (+),score=59.84 GEMP01028424.1:245-1108(+)
MQGKISRIAWLGLQQALGSEAGMRYMAYDATVETDETATLVLQRNDPRATTLVNVVTAADVVRIGKERWGDDFHADVFLLSLDIEGGEPAAIRGAEKLFATHNITFLVFMHTANLWPAEDRLGDVIHWLAARNYLCFFITAAELFPISGPFWRSMYGTLLERANVFCGKNGPETEAVYDAYHLRFSWEKVSNATLDEIIPGTHGMTLEEAQQMCQELRPSACQGVTCMCDGCTQHDMCTVRRGIGGPRPSRRLGSPEVSYLRPARHTALPLDDMLHPFPGNRSRLGV